MDIKPSINHRLTAFRAFFSAVPWKNLLSFLFFLMLAFIFWLTLFFKRNVEGSYKIPLKYINVPEDVVFDTEPPKFIEVRVADKGSEIFRYDLFPKDTIAINMAEYADNKNNIIQGSQYQQLLISHFSQNSKILGYFPLSISLATSKLESKKLLVVFDGEITTNRANLVADSATFLPETVIAYGANKSLSEIKNAITEYTVFNNLKATSQLPIHIKPIEGIKFVPNTVDIYIPIEEYTERTFEIPITAKNLPHGMDVKFFPSRTTVSFSVTLDEYKKISEDDFQVQLNYVDFHSNKDGRVELTLTHVPPTVRNPRISPNSVEFLFEAN